MTMQTNNKQRPGHMCRGVHTWDNHIICGGLGKCRQRAQEKRLMRRDARRKLRAQLRSEPWC